MVTKLYLPSFLFDNSDNSDSSDSSDNNYSIDSNESSDSSGSSDQTTLFSPKEKIKNKSQKTNYKKLF